VLGIEGEEGAEAGAELGAEQAAAEGIDVFAGTEEWDVLAEIPDDSAAALILLEHGLWIHDVLAFRGSPAAWNEALLWAASGTTRELTSKEAHNFRRLDQPIAATFTAADGPGFEAVTTRQHLPQMLDAFQQPGPHAESRS